MSKRFRLWMVMVVVLAAVAVWLAVSLIGSPPEPVYQGKKLSGWLEYYSRGGASTAELEKIEEAVRGIGSNGVPTLVKMIRAKNPPPVMQDLWDLAGKQTLITIRPPDPRRRRDEAFFAFQLLGTNAASAVRELITICADRRYPASQEYAASALGQIGPEAKSAIPVLVSNFTHKNANLRFAAVTAVLQIGGDPNVVVPAMIGALKDPDRHVRCNAVAALHRLKELTAVPHLLNTLQDNVIVPDEHLKENLENALWDLAPEKIAKPLVVEELTPMVTNGITTETLFRRDSDELLPLIPKGKSVRCSIYQAVGDKPLYLYRGVTQTSSDHFLGRFEASEPTINTNFEVVYIIDGQQIRLCARDYNRKEFPALRRVQEETQK